MSTEQDYEEMSVEEKVKRIEESASLGDLPARVLPPVPIIRPDMYFFISYSHKDYKKVYKDIFALQQQGVNIWYDGGMPVGKNWQEVAEEFILPYKCAGVIFYVSENSLMSDAIHKEMEFAKANGKMCITINLPIESDIVYNGESVQDKELSAQKMLDIMRDREQDKAEKVITDEKYKMISEMFGYSVLYLHYSELPENKKDSIIGAYNDNRKPLLIFEEIKTWDNKVVVAVVGIRDTDVKHVKKEDFVYEDKQHRKLEIVKIGNGAFANCRHLESIVLPNTIQNIGENAFYNCGLKQVNIPDKLWRIAYGTFSHCSGLTSITIPDEVTSIGNYAFSGCSGLTSITIPDSVIIIGDGAFYKCSGLTSITIPDRVTSIGNNVFSGCSRLTSITISDRVTSIGNYAFFGCSGLTSITIPDRVTSIGNYALSGCSGFESIVVSSGNTTYQSNGNCLIKTATKTLISGCKNSVIPTDGSIISIGSGAFFCCSGLTSLTIPDRVTSIGDTVFYGCSGLTSITFVGTKELWKSVEKKEWWDFQTGDYVVHCTDGDLKKGEF